MGSCVLQCDIPHQWIPKWHVSALCLLATRVMLRGLWRCDFPSLASRCCSSITVYFDIITKNLIKNNIPSEGINIYIHIYIVCGILLFIHNEKYTHVFMMNNNKTFYEHESKFSVYQFVTWFKWETGHSLNSFIVTLRQYVNALIVQLFTHVPTCSSDTLTNVLPHRFAMPQT